jgi:hypothetical protein
MITATIIGCGHGGQTLAADLKLIHNIPVDLMPFTKQNS